MALIDLPELARGVAGAWRLLKLDVTGMFHFNSSAEGTRRSFQAALFALPVHILLVNFALSAKDRSAFGADTALIEALLYVIDWTAIPVAISLLAARLDWQKRLPAYICAYNYSYLLVHWLWLMAVIVAGLLPGDARQVALTVVFIGLIAYQGIVARQALGLQLPQTLLFCIGVFLFNWLIELLRNALVLREALPG